MTSPRPSRRVCALATSVGLVIALTMTLLSQPASAATPVASGRPATVAGGLDVPPITTKSITITARDGVKLVGTVIGPKTGSWPLIVVPGTFAPDTVEMEFMAGQLAPRGYIIVTYAERGFGESGGGIDAGGPGDVNDASDALTWALANTRAIPEQVGIAGLSYGAGFVPIVAAKDPRFKAAASLSGWADMWRSLYPNNTGSYVMNLALGVLSLRSKPSPEVKEFFTKAVNNQFDAKSKAFAMQRSAVSYMDKIRQRPVPLYMSTSLNEMAWPIDQNIDFFNAYPGPKHLDLLPGDHSTSETGSAVQTLPATWSTAFDWFDEYVAGRDTDVASLPQIRVVPRSAKGPDLKSTQTWTNWPWETVRSTAPSKTVRQFLSTSSSWWGLAQTTTLAPSRGASSKRLRAGTNTLVNGGIPMYQGIFEVLTGAPTTVALSLVDQGVTGVWKGSPLTAPASLRGATKVHLDLTPSTAAGSVFAYLIDLAPDGTAYMIAHKPYSYSGLTPNRAQGVDFEIPYNAYDLAKGHRVVVAVSTDDANFSSNTPDWSSVQIGPGSYVDLPLP